MNIDIIKDQYDKLKPFESFQLCYMNDMKGKHTFPWTVRQCTKWETIEQLCTLLHDNFGVNSAWLEVGE